MKITYGSITSIFFREFVGIDEIETFIESKVNLISEYIHIK